MPDSGNQISIIPADNRQPRFRIAIGPALMIGFGTLVFMAAASVLGIGLWSARENTIELTRDGEELQVELLVDRVRGHLDPVMKANAYLAELMSQGIVDPTDQNQLVSYMRGAMAATPQVVGMGFLTPDFKMLRYQRATGRVSIQRMDPDSAPGLAADLDKAKSETGPYWGRLIWAAAIKSTLLNRRSPVRRNGQFIGVLITAIRLADLSYFLLEVDQRSNGRRSFLLYGNDYVLAHASMADGDYPRAKTYPIPAIRQVVDPVLQNLWNPKARRQGAVRSTRMQAHLLDIANDTYGITYRQIDGFAAVPLQAGTYRKLESGFGPQFIRLWRASVAGLIVVFIAVFGALWLGRRMARPIGDLANAAEKIRTLQLNPPPLVGRSRLTELDNAANAFNSMVSGLRWFETYVPRALVRSLLADDDDSIVMSAERDVTVIFTDIRSFTTLAESMTATETAEFLNKHFSVVAGCVEDEGGTVDKYIGDSVMAFWGAPYAVEDHAARACRAAIALRDLIAKENAENEKQGQPILKMGIGIHSGKVIAGNIGAPGRVNYTLVGDTVNLAQRLERLCKPLADPTNAVTILISRDVAEAVRGILDIEDCGTHEIRGRAASLEVFRLK
ncbi:MAG: adenylate/guanylate cyclase domain-containing protein [Proteobacteria bacterium]|nr:adenylate/guanylate cyclase domain-containing protein [Pseudomonadota bacterium]